MSRSLNTHARDVNLSNDDLNNKFVTTIRENADSIFPKTVQVRIRQPWHDNVKLQKLFIRKNELICKNANLKAVNSVRKKIRNRAKFLKNEHLKKQAEKLNQLAIN